MANTSQCGCKRSFLNIPQTLLISLLVPAMPLDTEDMGKPGPALTEPVLRSERWKQTVKPQIKKYDFRHYANEVV